MAEEKEGLDEADMFDLFCSKNCPRDIRFHCEALMDYNHLEISKNPVGVELKKKIYALLEAHFVVFNDPKSPPGFFCSMCQCPLKGVKGCVQHIMENSHQQNETVSNMKFTLERLQDPSEAHCVALDRCLKSVVEEFGMLESEIKRRQKLVGDLNEELEKNSIACSLTLVGSSATTLGFHDADINVMVVMNNVNQETESSQLPFVCAEEYAVYSRLLEFFQSYSRTVNITACSISKQCIIQLRDKESQTVTIGLSKYNKYCLEERNILLAFMKLSPLVRPLVLALRFWTKLVDVDDVRQEGLPPLAWTSMVVFFLQRHELLPVIDPSMMDIKEVLDKQNISSVKVLKPGLLGLTWVQLLRFYSGENLHSFVISLFGHSPEKVPVTKERKIVIADPFSKARGKKSVVQTSPQMYAYISKMLTSTFRYFCIPRTCHGALYETIVPSSRQDICSPFVFYQILEEQSAANCESMNETIISSDVVDPKCDPVCLALKVKDEKELKELLSSKPPMKLNSVTARVFIDHLGRVSVLEQDIALLGNLLPDWLYEFRFEREILQGKSRPPLFCKNCNSKQHCINTCPFEQFVRDTGTKIPVDVMNLNVLQNIISQNYDSEALRDHDYRIRADILRKLENPLLEIYPDASLELFGSSVNGFGSHYSDIDMCLLLNDQDVQRNTLQVMAKVQKTLYRLREFQVVYFVRHARIPIVKFRHIPTSLDGDVSACNTLAVMNSRLLRTYADIDPRVKRIGLFWKRILKVCDVSCASKSGLSSYGFTLMIIHYLQQLDQPILPILQQLQHGSLPLSTVEGWDVQYYSDLTNLKHVWGGYGLNRSSLGELWLGLLKYYSETFDFANNVITIRQVKPFTKISKFWIYNSLISIEDPFQLSFDVGSSLSRKSSIRILYTIRKLRDVFLSRLDSAVLETYQDWLSYFTDPKVVQYKEVNKCKCSVCGNPVGHKLDCPERRKKIKLTAPKEERFDEDLVL